MLGLIDGVMGLQVHLAAQNPKLDQKQPKVGDVGIASEVCPSSST